MDVFEAIKGRRSIRAFQDKDVPDQLVNRIIEAAQDAPSAGNLQARDFIIIRDKKIKRQLSEAAWGQYFIEEAPVVIVVCANGNRSERRYGLRGRNLYCLMDAAAAVQNLMLAAYALGLGTCWVGAFQDEKVMEILDIPEGIKPIAIIPVGYPGENPPSPSRLPLEQVVYREKYKPKLKQRVFPLP